MQINDITDNSVIIAAHPDDEVLWFSSIIDKVNQIIICFLEHASKPKLTEGRKKSLQQYPLKNMSCLGLRVSETLGGADWKNPVLTDIGIEISNQRMSADQYVSNFSRLQNELKERLIGFQNVITHNPWGEYGHEEHIQLYRVVKSLQPEMGFSIWFSNYCSNKSLPLMSRYASALASKPVTLKTNRTLSNDIGEIYKKNQCWTWYDTYQWPAEESFIKDQGGEKEDDIFGILVPFNMILIKIPRRPAPLPPKSLIGRVKRKFSGFVTKLRMAGKH